MTAEEAPRQPFSPAEFRTFPHTYGPWLIRERRQVHRDPWIAVYFDTVVRPDGQPGSYSTVHIKRGVCVAAIDEKMQVYLTREFHYAVGRETLEAVSGGIDSDETPLAAAQRELQEEAGLEAQQWDDLGSVDPFTASILSPTRLYLARGLRSVPKQLEGSETLTIETWPLSEAVEAAMQGEITHAPSCVLLFKAARLLRREMGKV